MAAHNESAVRDYLAEQFASVEVRVEPEPAGIVFRVNAGSSEYAVTVVREFLESHNAADIQRLLTEWNVAGELRRLDGLPMVISEEGVRLASSN
jgi:hypothetical protein